MKSAPNKSVIKKIVFLMVAPIIVGGGIGRLLRARGYIREIFPNPKRDMWE